MTDLFGKASAPAKPREELGGVRVLPVFRGEWFRGTAIVTGVLARGLLDPRLDLYDEAREFDWGRGVTPGARQLAFAIHFNYFKDAARSRALAPRFVETCIQSLPDKWSLTEQELIDQVAAIENQGRLL